MDSRPAVRLLRALHAHDPQHITDLAAMLGMGRDDLLALVLRGARRGFVDIERLRVELTAAGRAWLARHPPERGDGG